MEIKVNSLETKIDSLEQRTGNLEGEIGSVKKQLEQMDHRLKRVEISLESDVVPRLQTIESCYLDTYKRYQSGIDQIDTMQRDIDVLKKVTEEHSEKLRKIS